MSALPHSGWYATIDGDEYEVIREGGWKLISRDPASRKRGFQPYSHGRFARAIMPDEELEVVRLRYSGTYRGIPVSVAPNRAGTLVLFTEDEPARAAGFEPADRSGWVRVVAPDEADLKIEARRAKVTAPWLDRGRRGGEL